MTERWTRAVAAVLVVALLSVGGGPVYAAEDAAFLEYELERVGDFTWRYRLTGQTYEVTATETTTSETTIRETTITETEHGYFLTEGLGDRPISLNEAAAVTLRAAQAPGPAATMAGVQGQMWSIWNSTVAKARFISGAIADVWRAYNTYDDGRYMDITDRYEAWKAMGFYDKYNETQIQFINQRVIPIVRMAKAAQGVLGSVLTGAAYAGMAVGALAVLGVTAPAWVVGAGVAAVSLGVSGLTYYVNRRRHDAHQDMVTSPLAYLAGFGSTAGSFFGASRLHYADEVVRELRPGEFDYRLARVGLRNTGAALRMGDRALAGHWLRIGSGAAWRWAKPNLAGLAGSWLVGNATSSLLRAENLGTIPLPGQVVQPVITNQPVVTRQPSVTTNSDVIELRVRLVPSY